MDNYNNHTYCKKKEENFHGGSSSRSHNYNNNNRRSSSGNGWQQPSILSLEKKFCLVVGGVTWQKVLETQKYMYQDEKVLHWKDSAVQEAFWNAKKRFWAKMLGHPCDMELPDPDIFIDPIDWDSNVDPELIADLEKRDADDPCDTDQKDSGVVVGIPVIPEQYVFTASGWGDAEEAEPQSNKPEMHDSNTNGVGYESNGNEYDHWGDNKVNHQVKDGYESNWTEYDHWGDSTVNHQEKNGYEYVTQNIVNHEENRWNGGSTWNGYRKKQWNHGYNKKSDYRGRNRSRVNFYHNGNGQPFIDDYRSNKRGNFSNAERPMIKWKPVSRQW